MISIVYNRNNLTVSVNGHADGAPKGEDLVCSAVSILTYTLASNAEMICNGDSKCYQSDIRINEGEAYIHCNPRTAIKNVARVMFDGICVGFDILAQKYPSNVEYAVIEG